MRSMIVMTVLVVCTVFAAAQTKVSGTVSCGKPDQSNSIQVAEKHSFMISQQKCSWSKPMEFNGAKTKEAVYTSSAEVNGDKANERGFSAETLDNGDKMEVRTQSTDMMKDGAPISSDGKWTIVRGTGKAKGLKGGGTFKCSGGPDKLSCEVEGEYKAAPPPPAKK